MTEILDVGDGPESSAAWGKGIMTIDMCIEYCDRQIKHQETVVQAQLRSAETRFEQMLQQSTSSVRKEMATREERLMRRMDTERKEQQTNLFELRRDLVVQQTSDLAAHEDRLTRRLDGERREQKATLVELRRDLSVHQEQRVQIANLRRDLGTTQAALSKLAQSRLPSDSMGGNVGQILQQQQPKLQSLTCDVTLPA